MATEKIELVPGSAEDVLNDVMERLNPSQEQRWHASRALVSDLRVLAEKVGLRVIIHEKNVEVCYGNTLKPQHWVMMSNDSDGVSMWSSGTEPVAAPITFKRQLGNWVGPLRTRPDGTTEYEPAIDVVARQLVELLKVDED